MVSLKGIRGATTCDHNTKDSILEATSELLEELIENNNLRADDVAAAIFTTTQDLTAEFPSVAARIMGWDQVALMCSHEMAVPDAQMKCIRILILLNTNKPSSEITNIYLRGAKSLRDRGTDKA